MHGRLHQGRRTVLKSRGGGKSCGLAVSFFPFFGPFLFHLIVS